MEINGKKLQEKLLPALQKRVERLKKNGKTPGIGIITLGPEESWEAYVRQKTLLAKRLGIYYKLINLSPKSTENVLEAVSKLNSENTIQGLIVQRPFPIHIDTQRVIQSVSKDKDIDGFRKESNFAVPAWLAVLHILTHISQLLDASEFNNWLSNQSILVVGRGETAGAPVIKALMKLKIIPMVMDSKTEDRDNLFRKADIIIFAVGQKIDVPYKLLKKSVILIGIGLHRENGVLRGDFDENEAKENVLYYTPSPGGVGPLNLYYLFENLVTAAEQSY